MPPPCGCAGGSVLYFRGLLLAAAREALQMVLESAPQGDERKGGYFGVKWFGQGHFLSPTLVGEVTNSRDERYKGFCREKSERLEQYFVKNGHLLSFQSSNEEREEYPGATYGRDESHSRDYGLSFSGLPDGLADEAICLIVSVKCGLRTIEQAIEMANISDNQIFLGLVDKLAA